MRRVSPGYAADYDAARRRPAAPTWPCFPATSWPRRAPSSRSCSPWSPLRRPSRSPGLAWPHRQAGGRDDRPVAARRPPVEFTATLDLEPPVDRVDTVAFSARSLAERFIGDLAGHGLACTCLELQAQSENGEETVRRWRH